MKLPPRIKREKRDSRWRSQAHLAFVRSHACSVPGCEGRPIDYARLDVDELIDAFCKASPKAAEIRKVRAERGT